MLTLHLPMETAMNTLRRYDVRIGLLGVLNWLVTS